MRLRAALKQTVETVLVRAGVPVVGRLFRSAQTIVLAYHNVAPDDVPPGGDTSLHLPRAAFAAHLDALARTHDVVPLESLQGSAPHRGGRPRAILTFDDAYLGAMTVGVPELVRRGLPATFFVSPLFVGGGTFWWDALSAPGTPGPTPELRRHALDALRGEDEAIRDWARAAGCHEYGVADHARVAGEAEMAAATRHDGIVLASHSWSHANLARLEGAALAAEMERPLAWLRERFARVVPWLSYPYGASSPAAERAAEHAGYCGALTLDGGWIGGRPPRPFAVPRLNIPSGVSRSGFTLRASGAIPW